MKFSVITSAYNQLPMIIENHSHWMKQTMQDFEWIIADDGSDDAVVQWANENGIKVVTQPHTVYNLASILNKATEVAEGEHLAWVMGDSYPSPHYLEELSKHVADDRILSGLRMNVDKGGRIISPDWRVRCVFWDLSQPLVKVYHPRPWELMTLNSMCMPKKLLLELGGWNEGYKGYGREDWDVPAHAYYKGKQLYWTPNAIIYHREHKPQDENEKNITYFERRLELFRSLSKLT